MTKTNMARAPQTAIAPALLGRVDRLHAAPGDSQRSHTHAGNAPAAPGCGGQPSSATATGLTPLLPNGAALAERLRRATQRQPCFDTAKATYVALMQQIAADPAVGAIIDTMRTGHAPTAEYALGYALILSSLGVDAVVGPERLTAEDIVHRPPDLFLRQALGDPALNHPDTVGAKVAQRVAEICDDLLDLYDDGAVGA